MKQNQWFAVRCCCTPKKIFGFIKLPVSRAHAHLPDHHRTLTDCYGRQHPIKLLSMYDRTGLSDYYRNPRSPDAVLEYTVPEIAIYSDDRPIEFWRTIPGFVEAPPEGSS